jgi:prostaglandin-endoperoxide synthase 2
MTTEFSLLYRWHSLVPEMLNWGGTSFNGAQLLLNNAPLISSGLAASFAEVSANNATEIGLGNSATFLMQAEEKAVAQARTNNVASYNDYREAMDMDRADSFEDIVGKSSNPAETARRKALADELKRLYGTPENVEFYVGLFAEPVDENGPLPDLMLAMVAMDAFSQALTNPLLSKHVWGDKDNRELAFTKKGIKVIEDTKTVKDVLLRNASGLGNRFVGMTRADWERD